MKELDLTLVKICNEKAEISRRNRRAEKYIQNKKNRLEKAINKFLPVAVTTAVISSIIALCIVEYVHYNVFGTLL